MLCTISRICFLLLRRLTVIVFTVVLSRNRRKASPCLINFKAGLPCSCKFVYLRQPAADTAPPPQSCLVVVAKIRPHCILYAHTNIHNISLPFTSIKVQRRTCPARDLQSAPADWHDRVHLRSAWCRVSLLSVQWHFYLHLVPVRVNPAYPQLWVHCIMLTGLPHGLPSLASYLYVRVDLDPPTRDGSKRGAWPVILPWPLSPALISLSRQILQFT